MSETNNGFPNNSSMQEINSQTLSNIQQLQQEEQDLYTELQNKVSTNTITEDEKNRIIQKINEIYQIRMNLYATLKDTYNFYETNLSSSETTLKEQKYAIDIIEKQLKIERARLAKLQEAKYNKLRMVEYNSSYAAQYQAQTQILKMIALICIPLIIIILLSNQGIISSNIANVLIALTLLIGGSIVVMMFIDSLNRDNMNYNEYNWYFDPSKVDTSTTSTPVDPWDRPALGTCVGQACCSDNQTFDATLNKCVDNDTTQEAFVSNNLSKYAMNPPISGNLSVSDNVKGFSQGQSPYVSY